MKPRIPSHHPSAAKPERITLGVRPGSTPSPRPPVRIFLGTEPAQHRAERVFVWSIEQVRDSSRIYEIYLMKDLPGFEARDWTTGFTNYRFAIPHYTGGAGRAIYNDVDQIYLADPAELYDADLAGAGILSRTPDDTSVLLIDCERAARAWSLEAARRGPKQLLLDRAARLPGLVGPLPSEWNARDAEYEPGRSKLLHFTTLHTQPWRPFPDRFVYQAHPHADLWHSLEASANRAQFQVFTRDDPSLAYTRLCEGSGGPAQLEAVPTDDLPWVLGERFRASGGRLIERVVCGASRPPEWWVERFEAASRCWPDVRWELELQSDRGVAFRDGGRRPPEPPPRVWVLADDRPGNAGQSLGLIEALGWPYELKKLRPGPFSILHNRLLGASLLGLRSGSGPLEPPWPDLVIAAGRRTAPAALWIREQSQGRTRLVLLGRKGGDAAELFDLSVVPEYCRLFPHPRRIETSAPLHRLTPEKLARAAAPWRDRWNGAPHPWIAVLVGGSSGQFRLDAATGRRLGEDVARMAAQTGGSVLATTSRRTDPATAEAFCRALEGAAFVHRWSPGTDPGDNPYLGLLALADALVVTGDSESMLAEATSLGRAVYIYPLPERASFHLLGAVRDRVLARATTRPPGPRGTPRPQQGLERLCARLIDRGWVRPTRDITELHAVLVRRRLARRFGEPLATSGALARDEKQVVAERVRQLMGLGAP